ncbi:MAG: orotate phosphoribosyltransferase [Thalassobius sp.]|nr:orotate phosphoribosyltransferase [Thalassovita sp.]
MENLSEKIAGMLLDIEAVKISPEKPFTWASGWKSPIYCDNRLSLSHPSVRTFMKESLVSLIKEKFENIDGIAGVATAGIPQAALIADLMELPMLYVRSKPKGHGRENMIEGSMPEGATLVVIEDLISTGGSSLKAVEALIEAGYKVAGLTAIFTYGFDVAVKNFSDAKVPFYTLSSYTELLEVAVQKSYIKESELESLKAWREDPGSWGK